MSHSLSTFPRPRPWRLPQYHQIPKRTTSCDKLPRPCMLFDSGLDNRMIPPWQGFRGSEAPCRMPWLVFNPNRASSLSYLMCLRRTRPFSTTLYGRQTRLLMGQEATLRLISTSSSWLRQSCLISCIIWWPRRRPSETPFSCWAGLLNGAVFPRPYSQR